MRPIDPDPLKTKFGQVVFALTLAMFLLFIVNMVFGPLH